MERPGNRGGSSAQLTTQIEYHPAEATKGLHLQGWVSRIDGRGRQEGFHLCMELTGHSSHRIHGH